MSIRRTVITKGDRLLMGSFVEDRVSYGDTKKRTSTAYVKFTDKYRIVLRILNEQAKLTWKHWVKEANGGKGMMATCPNTRSQTDACPIDADLKGLPKDDPKVLERKAKARYVVNVLDRTPYTVCPACNEQTPAVGPEKVCSNCGASVKKNTFAPLNQVKLLEGGPRLFRETLKPIADNGELEWEKDITGYDITFQTQGEGRDRKIAAFPQSPVDLTEEDLVDTETGEPQRLFDLDILAEPNSVEEIELMLKGATIQDLNALRGIE